MKAAALLVVGVAASSSMSSSSAPPILNHQNVLGFVPASVYLRVGLQLQRQQMQRSQSQPQPQPQPPFRGKKLKSRQKQRQKQKAPPPPQLNSTVAEGYMASGKLKTKEKGSAPPTPRRRRRPRRSGAFPNTEWRAVPMSALREHPFYLSLPFPNSLLPLEDESSFSRIRQGTEAWDAVHAGRLTTSLCATVLGFYEAQAADFLGVPMGLRGHERAIRAYQRLQGGPPLEGYLQAATNALEREGLHRRSLSTTLGELAWCEHMKLYMQSRGWACELYAKGKHFRRPQRFIVGGTGPVRMAWGSAQEATALLAVLNSYHMSSEGRLQLAECGMYCGRTVMAGDTVVPLGASPDGMLVDSETGKWKAVVEVKCHSPFRLSRKGEFEVACSGPMERLLPWYVPQLYLEMACTGVKRGILCSMSALRGCQIMEIHWDPEYAQELMYFLTRFVDEFVSQGCSPRRNFFWGEDAYSRFLQHTVDVAASAQHVRFIEPQNVQRWDPHDSPFHDGT